MNNIILFILQCIITSLFSIAAIKLGVGTTHAFMSICWIMGNLFVLKQITLFNLNVIASDAFIIGANISIALLQEYYGDETAHNSIWSGMICALFFGILSIIHMEFIPNQFDTTQSHFIALLSPMTRIMIVSICVACIGLKLHLWFCSILHVLLPNLIYSIKTAIALTLSQLIDTILFAFLALYGTVESMFDIISLSFIVKMTAIILSVPIIHFCKKYITIKKIHY